MATLFSGLIRRLKGAADTALTCHPRGVVQHRALEQYAATLAAEHKIAEKPHRVNLLLPRLERWPQADCRYKHWPIRSAKSMSSLPREWLVDNFHIVKSRYARFAKTCKGLLHELPKLAEGDFKKYRAFTRFPLP